MTVFTVTANFSLVTSIEPEVRMDFLMVDDYSDDSYWQSAEVESDGGSVTFKVEAEDMDDADRKAEEIISSGMEVEDDNGLTWAIEGVSFDIEAPEMDKERAKEVVTLYLDTEVAAGRLTEEQQEAFRFLLDLL